MEIINYKAELNRNICYKLNGKIVSVPKTFVDELGTINDIIQDFDKLSIIELGEQLTISKNNVKKRVLAKDDNKLSNSGYALFGTILILSIIIMFVIVILGINFIIG